MVLTVLPVLHATLLSLLADTLSVLFWIVTETSFLSFHSARDVMQCGYLGVKEKPFLVGSFTRVIKDVIKAV